MKKLFKITASTLLILGAAEYSYAYGFGKGKIKTENTIVVEKNTNKVNTSPQQSWFKRQPKNEIIDAINSNKKSTVQPSAKKLSRQEFTNFDMIEPSKNIIDFAPENNLSVKSPRLTDKQALNAINELHIPTEQQTVQELQSIHQQKNFLNASPSMQKKILKAERAEQQKLLNSTTSPQQSWSSWFTPQQKVALEKQFNNKNKKNDLSSIETSSITSDVSSNNGSIRLSDSPLPETLHMVMPSAEIQQPQISVAKKQQRNNNAATPAQKKASFFDFFTKNTSKDKEAITKPEATNKSSQLNTAQIEIAPEAMNIKAIEAPTPSLEASIITETPVTREPIVRRKMTKQEEIDDYKAHNTRYKASQLKLAAERQEYQQKLEIQKSIAQQKLETQKLITEQKLANQQRIDTIKNSEIYKASKQLQELRKQARAQQNLVQ